jgi:chromosome segregation ATPase
MDKTKIIPIIFLIIIFGVAGVAYKFYSDSQTLAGQNQTLTGERDELKEQIQGVQQQKNDLQKLVNNLQDKVNNINSELDLRSRALNELQDKYDVVVEEREILLEKLNNMSTAPVASAAVVSAPVQQNNERDAQALATEHWADFVTAKAELQATVDNLNNELLDVKTSLAEAEKKSQELSIKIDQLNKEKQQLESEIMFKKRTMDIMSRDLVSERETRKKAQDDLEKMRQDNIGLKRELVAANKETVKLANTIKDITNKKDALDKRVFEIDNILKEKAMALEELEQGLSRAVKGGGDGIVTKDSASVELPPIVVKPDISGVKGLRSEVIAVNPQEKFIIIDAGENAGMRPGMQLKIIRGDQEIGIVEIVETRRDISAADVKSLVAGAVVKEGDIAMSK